MKSHTSIFLVAGVFFSLASYSLAEELRVFKNSDGKTIEATLVDVIGNNVTIKRVSDGQSFSIPANSLSLEDQAWISNWVKQRSTLQLDDWRNLRITLPTGRDLVQVIGIDAEASKWKTSSTVFDLHLPVGTWVFLATRSKTDPGELVEHLVQYRGESTWEVEEESFTMLLSRDGAPHEIVGVTPPREDVEAFFDQLDTSKLAGEICLELPDPSLLKKLDLIETEVVAFTTDLLFGEATVAEIGTKRPKALRLMIPAEAAPAISTFGPIEALQLMGTASSRSSSSPTTIDDIQLGSLPQVRDLHLWKIPFTLEMEESLAVHRSLRLFYHVVYSDSETYRAPPLWASIDTLSDTLQGLRIDRGIRLNVSDLASLTHLRHLGLGFSMIRESEIDDFKLPPFEKLSILDLPDINLNEKALRDVAREGHLKSLKRLSMPEPWLDFEDAPNLEFLQVSRYKTEDAHLRFSDLEALSRIRRLDTQAARDADLRELEVLPLRDTLETLSLFSFKATDLSPLSTLPNLRRIQLIGDESSLASLDVGAFPRVEHLFLSSMSELTSLSGVASHPTLTSLTVLRCPSFSDFGFPSTNATLRQLELQRLPSLSDLTTFSQTSGIQILRISECDALGEPLLLDQKNPLLDILVRDNAGLETRTTSQLVR